MHNSGMLKFFGEKGGLGTEHKGALHWPGTPSGFPFRGAVPPMAKQSELVDMPHVLDFHSRLFKLWDPEDKAAFDDTQDKIHNGWYVMRKRDDRWIESKEHYTVWLEWVQIYGEIANGKHPRAQHVATTLQLRPPAPQDGQPADGYNLADIFGPSQEGGADAGAA